jgi:hypothetical protein
VLFSGFESTALSPEKKTELLLKILTVYLQSRMAGTVISGT